MMWRICKCEKVSKKERTKIKKEQLLFFIKKLKNYFSKRELSHIIHELLFTAH
jgi:hypothetical protein